MFRPLRHAAYAAAASLAFAMPASAAIITVSFTGTADTNYVRDNFVETDYAPATLSGTVRIDTALLPPNLAGGDDFDFFSDIAPFLSTTVSLSGDAAPDFGGSVYVSNHLRGTFGEYGYVDLNDDRVAQDVPGAYDGSSFYLYATSGIGDMIVDGIRLPDFANTAGLSFMLYSDSVRTDVLDQSLISDHYVFASGTIDSVTVSIEGGVPEPASWAMMIAGFGLVGASARRRRATAIA